MKRIFYLFLLPLFMCFSCKKEKKIEKLNFDVTTEKDTYTVGENITFFFSGSPDIISMYSGEAGKNFDKGDYAIAVKGVSDKTPSYSYTFSKPGIYHVVFKAKNQNIHGGTEAVREIKLKIVGTSIPGIVAAVDYEENSGGVVNEQLDSDGNQTVDNLSAGDYLLYTTTLAEKGKIFLEFLTKADENSVVKVSLLRNQTQLYETNITVNKSDYDYMMASGVQSSPIIDIGEVIIKIEVISGKLSLKYLNVSLLEGFPLPGRIPAIEYVSNQGGRFENSALVDGGVFLGGISNNDYFMYDVNVLEEGEYKIDYRITAARVCTFEVSAIELSGAINILERINFPSTGGWSNWATLSGSTFYLTKGRKRIKITTIANGMSLSWFQFLRVQ